MTLGTAITLAWCLAWISFAAWMVLRNASSLDEAIAAAAREGGDVKQAPAESPQSGDESALTRKDAIALVTQMERIALDALGEGL